MATELSAQDFGRFELQPGGAWVRFRTSGYPRKLRREWDAASPDESAVILLRYVEAWSVVDVDGQPVELPAAGGRTAALLDNVEDALVMWLVRSFLRFWLTDLVAPRPNSSAPSPAS